MKKQGDICMGTDQIMTVEQLLNVFGSSIILWYFFIPTFITIMITYTIRLRKTKQKIKQHVKQQEIISNKEKTKSSSLHLEFDKTGRVRNNNTKYTEHIKDNKQRIKRG